MLEENRTLHTKLEKSGYWRRKYEALEKEKGSFFRAHDVSLSGDSSNSSTEASAPSHSRATSTDDSRTEYLAASPLSLDDEVFSKLHDSPPSTISRSSTLGSGPLPPLEDVHGTRKVSDSADSIEQSQTSSINSSPSLPESLNSSSRVKSHSVSPLSFPPTFAIPPLEPDSPNTSSSRDNPFEYQNHEPQQIPEKANLTPTKQLKPLLWYPKIISDEQESIWHHPDEFKIDYKDLETHFRKNKECRTVDITLAISNHKKDRLVWEEKRTSAERFMSRTQRDIPEIREAILMLDDTRLSMRDVQDLIKLLPSMEEMDRFYGMDDLNFSKSCDRQDRLLLMIGSVPFMRVRLTSWLFMGSFMDDVDKIKDQFETVNTACKELGASETLRKIIALVLQVGNYMNGGTSRGRVDGFDLLILNRLSEITSSDKKSVSLLLYISRLSYQLFPECSSLLRQLKFVRKAAHGPSLQEISSRLHIIKGDFRKMKVDCRRVKPENSRDVFIGVFQDFSSYASPKIRDLRDYGSQTTDLYAKTTSYFTSPFSSAQSTDFFLLLNDFMHEFAQCLPRAPPPQLQTPKASSRQQKLSKTYSSMSSFSKSSSLGHRRSRSSDHTSSSGKYSKLPTRGHQKNRRVHISKTPEAVRKRLNKRMEIQNSASRLELASIHKSRPSHQPPKQSTPRRKSRTKNRSKPTDSQDRSKSLPPQHNLGDARKQVYRVEPSPKPSPSSVTAHKRPVHSFPIGSNLPLVGSRPPQRHKRTAGRGAKKKGIVPTSGSLVTPLQRAYGSSSGQSRSRSLGRRKPKHDGSLRTKVSDKKQKRLSLKTGEYARQIVQHSQADRPPDAQNAVHRTGSPAPPPRGLRHEKRMSGSFRNLKFW